MWYIAISLVNNYEKNYIIVGLVCQVEQTEVADIVVCLLQFAD